MAQLNVQVDENLKRQLKAEAALADLSLAEFIEKVLKERKK